MWSPFWAPLKPFFSKESFQSILSLYAVVTSCKKNQKKSMHRFLIKLKKLHFGPTSFGSIFDFMLRLSSSKKSEKLQALIFHNTFKIFLLGHIWALLAQKPQNKIFPKNYLRQI